MLKCSGLCLVGLLYNNNNNNIVIHEKDSDLELPETNVSRTLKKADKCLAKLRVSFFERVQLIAEFPVTCSGNINEAIILIHNIIG